MQSVKCVIPLSSLPTAAADRPSNNKRTTDEHVALACVKPKINLNTTYAAFDYFIHYYFFISQVGRDNPPPVDMDLDLGNLDENAYRLIKYEFSEDVLRLPSIQVLYTGVCHFSLP